MYMYVYIYIYIYIYTVLYIHIDIYIYYMLHIRYLGSWAPPWLWCSCCRRSTGWWRTQSGRWTGDQCWTWLPSLAPPSLAPSDAPSPYSEQKESDMTSILYIINTLSDNWSILCVINSLHDSWSILFLITDHFTSNTHSVMWPQVCSVSHVKCRCPIYTWMNEWLNEWLNECLSEWMIEWLSEWMNDWLNVWVNE